MERAQVDDIVILGTPRVEDHFDEDMPEEERESLSERMERLGTEVAMVPVDELQPDWDNKSDEAEEALAEQLADVPLAKLFSGIDERAAEIISERKANDAVIQDKIRQSAIKERKKRRLKDLLAAVESGYLKEVKAQMALGTDANGKLDGVTPLIVAVTEGHRDIVEHLIVDDVDLNGSGRYNMTALHHACHLNNYSLAKLLLQHGANPTSQTSFGITPLHIACREGNMRMIRLLLLFGADQFIMDKAGKMPHAYAQNDKVQKFIQEFAGRYMLQVMKQNKELQSLLKDQAHEIALLKQKLSMMSEVVEVQHNKAAAVKEANRKKEAETMLQIKGKEEANA